MSQNDVHVGMFHKLGQILQNIKKNSQIVTNGNEIFQMLDDLHLTSDSFVLLCNALLEFQTSHDLLCVYTLLTQLQYEKLPQNVLECFPHSSNIGLISWINWYIVASENTNEQNEKLLLKHGESIMYNTNWLMFPAISFIQYSSPSIQPPSSFNELIESLPELQQLVQQKRSEEIESDSDSEVECI